jgi:hypothetical protein
METSSVPATSANEYQQRECKREGEVWREEREEREREEVIARVTKKSESRAAALVRIRQSAQ